MPNLFTLVGKTAIVTGAGGGIGQAICRALYHAGARVAVTDIDLAAAAAVVNRLGPSCMAERLDVTDAEDVARAFDAIVGALGALDILVANAGLSTMNPVVSLSEEEWDRNMSVNAKGIFLTNREAVRRFIKESTPGVRGCWVYSSSRP
jgi:meso-butanediol dehydrogenase/(S,S)-butanediol dehydrogenase/diacetyl reductase